MGSVDEEHTKRLTLIISICAFVLLAFMTTLFVTCQFTEHRRAACIEQTHDLAGCRRAFPEHGDEAADHRRESCIIETHDPAACHAAFPDPETGAVSK
jgi:hypothetical protein